MPEFEVIAHFESMRFERLTSSSEAALPEAFEFGHMTVTHDEEHDRYVVRQLLSAESSVAVKRMAIDKVREMLRLFAVSNDAFRTRLGRDELSATLQPDDATLAVVEESKPDPEIGARTIHVYMTDMVYAESHSEVRKLKGFLDFEASAFARRDEWPEWLPVALELNYLATTSHEMIPAFVIYYAALDLIVNEKLGHPTGLLKSQLSAEDLSKFDRRLRQLLSEFGVDAAESEIERVVARLYDAHADSRTARTEAALDQYGIDASGADIRRVIRQRGRVAHGDLGGDPSGLETAFGHTRTWVQQALKVALTGASSASGD